MSGFAAHAAKYSKQLPDSTHTHGRLKSPIDPECNLGGATMAN